MKAFSFAAFKHLVTCTTQETVHLLFDWQVACGKCSAQTMNSNPQRWKQNENTRASGSRIHGGFGGSVAQTIHSFLSWDRISFHLEDSDRRRGHIFLPQILPRKGPHPHSYTWFQFFLVPPRGRMFFVFFSLPCLLSCPLLLSSPPPLLLITRTSFSWSLLLTPSVSPCWHTHTHIEMCLQLGVFSSIFAPKMKNAWAQEGNLFSKRKCKRSFHFLGAYCRAHTCTYTPVMYPSGVTLAFWPFENLSKYARAHYKWWQFGPVLILALHISSLYHCAHPIL